ncbi:MAG: STAS domain-containing protein [Chloroflexi bacterium]|nr:STAS domain-containing protein [Chloroflexota bacterium]
MEITAREHKRVVVIRVSGRVDATTTAEFEAKIKEYVTGGHPNLVLELDAADYISSAGLRVLISAQKALKAKGGKLVMAQPSDRVKEVMQLAGLDPLFPIFPDTESAVGAV